MLANYGIQSQTPMQIEPIEIWPPAELVKAYDNLGCNAKLKLTGRPSRPVGVLIYGLRDGDVVFFMFFILNTGRQKIKSKILELFISKKVKY